MRADWPAAAGTVLRVDGGMTASDVTMQFLADILGAPVDRPVVMETTALGAAYLAGYQAGVCPDLAGFSATWRLDRRFEPAMDDATRARKWAGWQDAVARVRTSPAANRVNKTLTRSLSFSLPVSRRSQSDSGSIDAGDWRTHGVRGDDRPMDSVLSKLLQPRIEALKVLVVDDDQYMRKVVRTMLITIGVKTVYEASDGIAGLEAIRSISPDLVILDWEMPMIDGAELVRIVRSPGVFPVPDIPIIMLSGHGDRWRVVEAARIGVHEYLLKPVSTKALLDRIVAIIGRPRPTVQLERLLRPGCRAGWS